MATQVDIIANALIELGVNPISDINDGSDIANTMKTIYTPYKRHLLSSYPYNFTKKRQQLARSSSNPLFQFKYAYQIPSDSINVLSVYTTNATSQTPFLNWTINHDKVEADSEELYLSYQVEVNDQDLPPYFIEFFAIALAEKACMTITDNSNLKALLTQRAFGNPSDNLVGGLCGQARRIDAQQTPPEVSNNSVLIDSRLD